jgi:hypothetical protein
VAAPRPHRGRLFGAGEVEEMSPLGVVELQRTG